MHIWLWKELSELVICKCEKLDTLMAMIPWILMFSKQNTSCCTMVLGRIYGWLNFKKNLTLVIPGGFYLIALEIDASMMNQGTKYILNLIKMQELRKNTLEIVACHEHLYLLGLKCWIWYPSSMFAYCGHNFLWQMAIKSDVAIQIFIEKLLVNHKLF